MDVVPGWDNGDGKGRVINGDKDLSLLENASPLMFNLAKNNSWHGVFCAPRKIPRVIDILEDVGFSYFGEIIWNKRQPGLGYSIRYAHETFVVIQKGNPTKSDDAIISVLTCSSSRDEIELHPHAKPLLVMRRLVSWLCPLSGVVSDWAMGIGTTGIACKQTGRNFIGCELDPVYFEIARKRIEAAARQGVMFTEVPQINTPNKQPPLFPT